MAKIPRWRYYKVAGGGEIEGRLYSNAESDTG